MLSSPPPSDDRSVSASPTRSGWPAHLARHRLLAVSLALLAIAAIGIGGYQLKKKHDQRQFAKADTMPMDEAAARAETEALQPLVIQALAQRQWNQAATDAMALVKRHPDYAPARILLAQCFLANGRHDQAYEHLKYALSLPTPATVNTKPQAELQMLAGTVAQQVNRPDLAQNHFATAVALLPQEVKPRLMLASSLMAQQKFTPARDAILMALTLDQRSHKAYALMADLYNRQNQTSLAMDQIQKAIDLVPVGERTAQVSYLRVKAGILRRANQPDQAMQVLLSLKPKERLELEVLEEMALCLAMQGKATQAAALVESRLEVDPSDDVAAIRTAHWYLQAGDKKNARRLWLLAKAVNPSNPDLPELERRLTR